MPSIQEFSNDILALLQRRRKPTNHIPEISSVELLEQLDLHPSHYAVALGQAISLIDAACLSAALPWIGRLVIFRAKRNDLTGAWGSWNLHMKTIIEAPTRRRWTDADFSHISTSLPHIGPVKWWQHHELQSDSLLQEALLVALKP